MLEKLFWEELINIGIFIHFTFIFRIKNKNYKKIIKTKKKTWNPIPFNMCNIILRKTKVPAFLLALMIKKNT